MVLCGTLYACMLRVEQQLDDGKLSPMAAGSFYHFTRFSFLSKTDMTGEALLVPRHARQKSCDTVSDFAAKIKRAR